jgi:glycosyltransferase involved in cell wall biosynthesis
VSKVKRIVIVGPAYPLRGGIAHFNESFCNSLTENGLEASIVSFYLQYPAIFFPGKTQNEREPREVSSLISPLLSSVNPRSWRRAAKHILQLKPDMVVIRFWLPFVGPALGSLARMLGQEGVKVMGLVDNAIPHERRPFDRGFSRWFFRHCHAFLTLSQRVADDLKYFAPTTPVHVHPHPVYDIFGSPVSKTDACRALGFDVQQPYLLFFGFVRRYKGLDLLLEAMGDPRVKALGLKLIVAGEFYEDKKPYLEIMERHSISDQVVLHDRYIPTEEVRNYFCAASLVTQTYRDATQSGVTQIAYQFGRPMIVTSVGGLPEIVPDAEVGYVVEPNALAIADAITRFFEEGHEAAFAANALARRHLFSWQHFTEDFLKFAETIHEQ